MSKKKLLNINEKKKVQNNQKIKKIPKSIYRTSSKVPYIVVITKTPNNLFLAATDFLGNTKV
jgi:hypothetical protein